jgi:hypothetical protein
VKKYMLLFTSTMESQAQWEAMAEPQREQAFGQVMEWFDKHADKIIGGYQLQPERTATTVRFNGSKTVVTDGPFIEAKETIGGYAIVDVGDLDDAIALARTWPARGAVEVRPVVERPGPPKG